MSGYSKTGLALLCCSIAFASADSFVGTWKFNPGKSSYKSGRPPKEETIAVSQQGKDYDVTIQGTGSDGSTIFSHYKVPVAGGKGSVIESGSYDAVQARHLNARTHENTYYVGSKKVMTATAVMSRDGRMMKVTLKGIGLRGPVEGLAVYERQ